MLKKKYIIVVFMVFLGLLLFSGNVKAEVQEGTIKEMGWSFDTETGTLTVSGKCEKYYDFLKAIGVEANDIKVLKVGEDVETLNIYLDGCKNLTTVELENENTEFSDYTLYMYKCDNITNVKHGKNIEEKYDPESETLTISGKGTLNRSFIMYLQEQDDYKELIIENGIVGIGRVNGYYLEKVELPESLVTIGESAFDGCSSLKSIKLPSKLESIKDNAFYGCRSLTSINIPDSVKELGSSCFANCENLEEVKLSKNVKKLESELFSGCKALTEIIVPEAVEKIDTTCFSGCDSLTDVEVKNGECEIESSFFSDEAVIPNITDIKIGDMQYKLDEAGTLEVSGSKKIINCDSACNALGDKMIKTIKINDGVEEIGDKCFYDSARYITKVELPKTLTTIGEYNFYNSTELKEITIPSSVEKIGGYSFKGSQDLTIKCESNSYAQKYAKENEIKYKVINKKDEEKEKNNFVVMLIGIVAAVVVIIIISVIIIKKKKR